MIYNNINITATTEQDIELCKVVIDRLKTTRYELYETILTFTIDPFTRFFEYTTCLHEDKEYPLILMSA